MLNYKSIPYDQFFITASHDNNTVSKNYYHCIAKIKKIISPYAEHEPILVELNLTQMYRGYNTPIRKETNITIHQFQYNNNLSDLGNTYCAYDNMVDFNIKFLYDDNYIYIYAKSNYETYGGYIVIQPKKVFGARRVEIINNAKFEALPNLSELKTTLMQTSNLNYFETANGDSDYTKFTKIADLKVKIGDGTTLPSAITVAFTVVSPTSNASRYAKFYVYLSRISGQDRATILYGYNNMVSSQIYVVTNTDSNNIKTMSVYVRLNGSGAKSKIKLEDYISESTIPNKNIFLYENQPFYAQSEIVGDVVTITNGI